MKKLYAIIPLLISLLIPTLGIIVDENARRIGLSYYLSMFALYLIVCYTVYFIIYINNKIRNNASTKKTQPNNQQINKEVQLKQNNSNPVPKCPTCGSTNIRRIGATERGANALMFGLLGNKRKCQFECQNPNCRYRW